MKRAVRTVPAGPVSWTSGEFPRAMETLRGDLATIRAARGGAKLGALVIDYSSVAPDEAGLSAFGDATLYRCGCAVEVQRGCAVLNGLFPRPRFIAGGTAEQSAPGTAFENWRETYRKN